ncbi:hypothetical protein [Streptomyces alboflavus]|uniref:hypothetical protein n=1 Tax=Streptomyces alboflavus TaxID=67267 RepID=UPI0036CB8E9B
MDATAVGGVVSVAVVLLVVIAPLPVVTAAAVTPRASADCPSPPAAQGELLS